MVSITCPCIECKYNGKGHKCTAKAINLTYRNIATVNEGRVNMWICDKYELSEFAKQVDESINNFLNKSFEEFLQFCSRGER
jgi:hypothetical protein